MAKIEILKAVDFINLNTKISCQLDYSIDGGEDDFPVPTEDIL